MVAPPAQVDTSPVAAAELIGGTGGEKEVHLCLVVVALKWIVSINISNSNNIIGIFTRQGHINQVC